MNNENYKVSSGSLVVKRSPVVRSRKHSKSLERDILGPNLLRKSLTQNISSLDKALSESEKILPRTNNKKILKTGNL